MFTLLFNLFVVGGIVAVPAAGIYAMTISGDQIHSGHNPDDVESSRYEFVSNYCGDHVLVRKQ